MRGLLVPVLGLLVLSSCASADGNVWRFYPFGPGVEVGVMDDGKWCEGTLYPGALVDPSGHVMQADAVMYKGSLGIVFGVVAVNGDGTVEVSVNGVEATGLLEACRYGFAFTPAVVRLNNPQGTVEFLYVTEKGVKKVTYGSKEPVYYRVAGPFPVGPDEVMVVVSTDSGAEGLLLDEAKGEVEPVSVKVATGCQGTVVAWDGKVFVLSDLGPYAAIPIRTFEVPKGETLEAMASYCDVVALVLKGEKGVEVAAYDVSEDRWLGVRKLGEKDGALEFLVSWRSPLLLKYRPGSGRADLEPYPGSSVPSGGAAEVVRLERVTLRLTDPSIHGGVRVDLRKIEKYLKVRKLSDHVKVFTYAPAEGTLYEVKGDGVDVYAVVSGSDLIVVPRLIFLKVFEEGLSLVRGERAARVTLEPRDGTVEEVVSYPRLGEVEVPGCMIVEGLPLFGGPVVDALKRILHARSAWLGFPSLLGFTSSHGHCAR